MSAGMDPRVIDAIGTAYYARATGAADLARSRAQNGFTVASFLAGGLVGAGLLSRLASVPIIVRVIGACALAAWVVGAALYARAIAEPVALTTGTQENAKEFVSKVLENAKEERDKIDSRRRVAQRASIVAAALTTLAVVLGLLITAGPETKPASIVLTAQGAAALRVLCGTDTNLVRGQLNMASLENEFLNLRADIPQCVGKELHLARSDVIEIITNN